jgi:diacylglycerol O-acyltransferase
VPLYLAGARLLEVFPVLPLIANEPLGVGALSYAGRFTIGVVADRDAYPDLDAFAAGLRDELHALGVPTHPTPIRPTGEMVTHVRAQG